MTQIRQRVFLSAVAVALVRICSGGCGHESVNLDLPDVATGDTASLNSTRLHDGIPIMDDIRLNMSKHYYYESYNVTMMKQPERYRKLIFSLEPCEGVVYLLVRKTRRCWPDPQSCCQPKTGIGGIPTAPPCNSASDNINCPWTHFHSVIDGSRDGAPTFFEVSHTAAKYFITVFAPKEVNLDAGVSRPKFRLSMLSDIGAYPRPGLQGQLRSKLTAHGSVEVSWDMATFIPVGVSDVKNYYLYSSLLLATDRKVNQAVFLTPSKVMNSACGLERNAVKYGSPISPAQCLNGICRAVVSGILPSRRYMLNILVESHRSFNATYSGLILSAEWKDSKNVFSEWSTTTNELVTALVASVFGVLGTGYIFIVSFHK